LHLLATSIVASRLPLLQRDLNKLTLELCSAFDVALSDAYRWYWEEMDRLILNPNGSTRGSNDFKSVLGATGSSHLNGANLMEISINFCQYTGRAADCGDSRMWRRFRFFCDPFCCAHVGHCARRSNRGSENTMSVGHPAQERLVSFSS